MLPQKFWRYRYLEHLSASNTLFEFSMPPSNMPTNPDLVYEEWYFQIKLARTPWSPFLWNHCHCHIWFTSTDVLSRSVSCLETSKSCEIAFTVLN